MKKLLSITIVFIMLLGLIPTAIAEETKTYKIQYFKYEKGSSLHQLDYINISNTCTEINEGESYISKLSPKTDNIEIDSLVVIMGENTPVYPTKNDDGSYVINIPKVMGDICIAVSIMDIGLPIYGGHGYNYYITNLTNVSSQHCNELKERNSEIATTQIKGCGTYFFKDVFTPDEGYEIVDLKVTTSDNFNENQRDITNDDGIVAEKVVTKNDDGSYTVSAPGGASIYVTAVAEPIGSSTTTKPSTTITTEPKPVEVKNISLNKTQLVLNKGTFTTLRAVVTPSNSVNKAVNWNSSNTKVAKVTSSGNVLAVGKGNCTITATSKSNSKIKATCKVTVTTSTSLTSTNISLKSGTSKTIKAVGGTVKTWTTSNKNVATVKDGKITALSKGTATVTATLTTGKKLSCKVVVSTAPRLTKTTVKVKKGDTVLVKLSGKVATINNKYTNTKVAKITSKTNATTLKIKGLKKGTTTLKIKVNGVKNLSLKVNVK